MSALVVGVMGHVDHGKTTLVRALTGIETDRLAEERRRGISMVLGFAHVDGPRGTVDVIDMPGHERFVRTAIGGATGVDAILLAVAADEGVRPQTVEHVEIAALLGIARAVVAVTRTDRADTGRVEVVWREARALLARNGIEAASVVPVCAPSGEGLDTLREALGSSMAAEPEDDGFAWLAVDRAFSMAGAGTVVTGTLRCGAVHVGDRLEAFAPNGRTREVRVRAIEVRGERAGTARPGRRTALNLRGVEPASLPRGSVLASPAALAPGRFVSVRLRTTPSAGGIANGARLLLLTGTDEVEVGVRLLDADALGPGASSLAQLRAARPVAIASRMRFVLRVASPARTVAGGTVLDVEDRRLRRHPASLAMLAARDGATTGAIVTDALTRAGSAGTTLAALGRAAGVSAARAASLLSGSGAIVTRGGAVAGREAFARLMRRVPALVASGERPDGIDPAIWDQAVRALVERGVLARDGNRLRVRDPARDASEAHDDAARMAALAARLRREGLTPPDRATLAPDPGTRRMLDRLVRNGILIAATDRVHKRDWVFHAEAVVQARQRLASALAEADGGLLVGEAGALLGLTRRHSVPLLEHLDAVRFTRRIGDRRVLAERARE